MRSAAGAQTASPEPSANAAPSFARYVDELLYLAAGAGREGLSTAERSRVHGELDGNASLVYRQRVALDLRRDRGSFFTGHTLADRLLGHHIAGLRAGDAVLDPACGLGDLLLGAARHLPVLADLSETVSAWGERLGGHDLRHDFIAATKARLYLLALARGAAPTRDAPAPADCFPDISQRDFFNPPAALSHAHIVLLNPPYGRVPAPQHATWAAGGVSAAAIFALEALKRLPAGGRMSAILPDVLRSGTRYAAWRREIEQTASIDAVTPVGRFDPSTDVDVFILHARAGASALTPDWWPSPPPAAQTIGDHCAIMVGSVVPHRHAEEGPDRAYIHARLLPAGGRVRAGEARRRFAGTVLDPPFVAIRRTSRPVSSGPRLLATVVAGEEPVAVENHLIVVRPHSGDLTDCDNLIKMLASDAVTSWLDERIRCRHLTVAAVRQLPWLPSQS